MKWCTFLCISFDKKPYLCHVGRVQRIQNYSPAWLSSFIYFFSFFNTDLYDLEVNCCSNPHDWLVVGKLEISRPFMWSSVPLSILMWGPAKFLSLVPSETIWHDRSWSTLVQVMSWHVFGAKPLLEPLLTLSMKLLGARFSEIFMEKKIFIWRKCIWKNIVCKMSGILSQPPCVNP